jgi:hypothetical protein
VGRKNSGPDEERGSCARKPDAGSARNGGILRFSPAISVAFAPRESRTTPRVLPVRVGVRRYLDSHLGGEYPPVNTTGVGIPLHSNETRLVARCGWWARRLRLRVDLRRRDSAWGMTRDRWIEYTQKDSNTRRIPLEGRHFPRTAKARLIVITKAKWRATGK